ncbi:Bug family tripartite tricarboxylate transporter substrate binding protein [Bradyrhizobium sp. STM 3566]|uniref:Bug family tripartite tricarboxylate transporter substrate binding protein n=1 Tax=Bradyrhizobium sp. STM 3566 TaxID=578928 RepID=UPI00388DE344
MQLERRNFTLGLLAVGTLSAKVAFAQSSYPARPVRLIVPYPPGGGTDFFARVVGSSMAQSLGQTIVVENRPGAGSIIGAEVVSHAEPDGYTLLLGDVATYAINPSLYKKLPYDPQRDFAPISLTGRFAVVLLVNTNKVNVHSVAELVEAAKKSPGSIDYASGGIGTPFHLASELFARAAEIELHHVPYRGAAPALQDLVAGQIGLMFVDFASARSQLTTPGIKALAVASLEELAGLPHVPTMAASGYPDFEVWAWQGFVAPARTPPEIVERLRTSYLAAIQQVEVKHKLEEAGMDVRQSTPDEFASYMRDERERWGALIKKANIHAD